MNNEPLPLGAVVAGHICLDIIPDLERAPEGHIERLLQPGRLVEIGPATLSAGGAVSNTGGALDRLGIPVRLAAKVGSDALAAVVRSILNSYHPGLADGISSDASAGTSYSLILNPPGVDRIFWNYPGANDCFSALDIPYPHLSEAALFHFGYPPIMRQMYAQGGAELVKVVQQAKATGVTVSLDTAFPDPERGGGKADWRAIFQTALPFVDIFLPSLEELMVMLRPAEYRRLQESVPGGILGAVSPALLADVSAELIAMGVRVVVIKLGERGLYLRTARQLGPGEAGRALSNFAESWLEKELWAPGFKVQVVGTTGAGDAAIAGFLSAVLRGLSPELALTIAAAVGACNVEAADALSGIPAWDALNLRLGREWERLPLGLPLPGWTWEPRPGIWVGPYQRGGS